MKCPHCEKPLGEKVCPACGSGVLNESSFCHRCGISLGPGASVSPEGEEEDIDFAKRVLCSDGTCIGVINEKGFCKVCGKPYTKTDQ